MTIAELKKALNTYPDDAQVVVGVTIPDLFINAIANGSIIGNAVKPEECSKVQFLATVPSRNPFAFRQEAPKNANTDQQGAVQEG